MADLVVLYKTPTDPAAFDKHYFETHVPLVKKMPGLRKYTVAKAPIRTPGGPSPLHLIATLTFDDLTALQAARASPEGQAAAADVAKFAAGGVDVLFAETAVL